MSRDAADKAIIIGSDHAGFSTKERVKQWLTLRGFTVEDAGCYSEESADYPEYGKAVAEAVVAGRVRRGVLICGTGLGMCYTANRYPEIRAALCWSAATAEMSRSHNDANILILPARAATIDPLEDILLAWFDATFSEDERHVRRIGLIEK